MHTLSGILSRNPSRIACPRSNLAIQRSSQFQVNEWAAGAHKMQILLIKSFSLIAHQTNIDLNPQRAQMVKSFA